MARTQQTFENQKDGPVYVSVEPWPECFELEPGDKLTLIWNAPETGDAVQVNFINERELVLWPNGDVDDVVILFNGGPSEGDAPLRYLLRRIIRIAPPYWFFTAVMVAAVLLAPEQVRNTRLGWTELITSALFIAWPRADGHLSPIVSQGWTLNFEAFFYVSFAAAFLLITDHIGIHRRYGHWPALPKRRSLRSHLCWARWSRDFGS